MDDALSAIGSVSDVVSGNTRTLIFFDCQPFIRTPHRSPFCQFNIFFVVGHFVFYGLGVVVQNLIASRCTMQSVAQNKSLGFADSGFSQFLLVVLHVQ